MQRRGNTLARRDLLTGASQFVLASSLGISSFVTDPVSFCHNLALWCYYARTVPRGAPYRLSYEAGLVGVNGDWHGVFAGGHAVVSSCRSHAGIGRIKESRAGTHLAFDLGIRYQYRDVRDWSSVLPSARFP